jgi:hypothetical protein
MQICPYFGPTILSIPTFIIPTFTITTLSIVAPNTSFMLSVANKYFMLNVVMLSVIVSVRPGAYHRVVQMKGASLR